MPVRAFLAALLASAQTAQESSPAGAQAGRIERRLSAMGTWLELRVSAADRATALAASERAVRAIEACEARLSTWRADSELALLNRVPVGTEVTLSPELAADLERARRLWRATEGAFDPGLGALVEAWGLRTGGRQPSADELERARAAGGLAGFELEGRRASRRHERATIEEGGFGKGIGLDAALAALAADGVTEAVVDLGGQLAALGAPCTTTLADPRDRARAVLELTFAPGSLSTTANSERGIVVEGVRRAHVLDPRSGEPAEDFGSLSIWAADATAADGLSTGLYVLGPEQAFRWRAAQRDSLPIELVVLVPAEGRLRAFLSEGWRAHARALVPDLELCFVPEGSTPSLSPSPPR